MQVEFSAKFSIYPYIDKDKLMLDCVVNGDDIEDHVGVSLQGLFEEYMSYFRSMRDGTIDPQYSKEIRNTVGLLRLIAREMETELEGSRE